MNEWLELHKDHMIRQILGTDEAIDTIGLFCYECIEVFVYDELLHTT